MGVIGPGFLDQVPTLYFSVGFLFIIESATGQALAEYPAAAWPGVDAKGKPGPFTSTLRFLCIWYAEREVNLKLNSREIHWHDTHARAATPPKSLGMASNAA